MTGISDQLKTNCIPGLAYPRATTVKALILTEELSLQSWLRVEKMPSRLLHRSRMQHIGHCPHHLPKCISLLLCSGDATVSSNAHHFLKPNPSLNFLSPTKQLPCCASNRALCNSQLVFSDSQLPIPGWQKSSSIYAETPPKHSRHTWNIWSGIPSELPVSDRVESNAIQLRHYVYIYITL